MPVGENDLGKVADTTTDLLADVKELGRELNKVNAEIERAQRKNQQLSPELEKRQKELSALYKQANNTLLQSSGRALLNPQAAKEVQAEAKKVIDAELRQIQSKLARTIISGGRVDSALVGRQSELQSILNAYESRGQTQVAADRAARQAMRDRLDALRRPGGRDVFQDAFTVRRKFRDMMSLTQDLLTGNIGMGTVLDAQDTFELLSTGAKWIGTAATAKGALGLGAKISTLAAKIEGMATATQAALPYIAVGGAITYGLNQPALQVIGDINTTRAAQERARKASERLGLSQGDIMAAVGYNKPLTPMSVREGMTDEERARFNYIAKLAGDNNYDANPFGVNRVTFTPGLAIEKARNQAAAHISKILGDFQKANFNVYAGAVRRFANQNADTNSMESLHGSALGAMTNDVSVLETIQKDLARAEALETAQANYMARADKQTRWKLRYEERALAELEKQNLLAAQDWSRR